MDFIGQFKELQQFFEEPDFTDVKVVEGAVTLRAFIASMLSYYPWWIILLYRIRTLVVFILRLVKHEAPEELPNLSPEEVSFMPGERVTFFIVRKAKEDVYWFAETPEDKHLSAYFGIVVEPLNSDLNRFYVVTTLRYRHWTGPVYFNLIRPFHHLVVSQMARAGVKSKY